MYKQVETILENDNHSERVYAAALWYQSNGIFVLPIMKNGKKLPPKETGINYGSASNKKATIEKWFHPDRGKYAGWNIGIACGKIGGVMAVDIDQHKDVNGQINWETELRRVQEDEPEAPVQLTPNGGRHLLFRWKEGCGNTTDGIAEGVDTRGGTGDKCKGHIVAFPSMVNKKMYHWDNWCEIPEVPDWIRNKIDKTSWTAPVGEGRGNEQVTSEDIETPVDHAQIKRMLAPIDPNDCDYDKWIRIGMSIKSQYPEEDGLQLWEEWSLQGERYKDGECYSRWEGFSDFGTVRMGTLFYYAEEAGWEMGPSDRKGNAFDRMVAVMNEEYAVVTIGGKIRILREKTDVWEMDMHYELYDKDSFKTLMENQTIEVMINDKIKKVKKTDIWLGHEGRRTYINGVGLFPQMATPIGYYNTWNGFAIEPKKGDCNQFLDHIKHVICDDNYDHNEWLLDWLADLLQDPSDPKGCALVMRGDEGTGKGLLANTIGSIFGQHHRHLIDDNHLTSNFNAHLLDAVTVFADEITWGGNKKTAGKLKGLVTERHLVGERKGVDAILYRNMVHLIIASNSEWVIPAGSGSRRWFVVNVSAEKKGNRKYFDSMYKGLKQGGTAAFMHMLLERRILSDLRLAPETIGLTDQRILNTQGDTVFHWWRKCIIGEKINVIDLVDMEAREWPRTVGKIDLYEAYEIYVLNRRENAVIENVFAKRMMEYGVVSRRIKTKNGPDRVRVYELPDVGQATTILNNILPGSIENE